MEPVYGLAERVSARLGEKEGVVAVALVGSWARGEASPDSDVDLGIYYGPDAPSGSKTCAGSRRSSTTATRQTP